jgi:Tol biopolymer transport system component
MWLLLAVGWLAAPRASQLGANDGFLLFATDRNDPSEEPICPTCEEIYVMYPDGSVPTRLTDNEASDNGPVWSHSRKTVAFHSNRSGPPEIFLMNLDGSDQRLLVSLDALGALFPSFSQSGNELCFNSQVRPRDIYIVNIHGTGLTNLTNQAGDNLRCDWSPKNNDIAFGSTRHGNEEIYVMNADGSDESIVRLTTAGGTDANPDWSPKGDRIAFESNRDGNPEIYVMNADGTDQVRLTFFAGQDTKPTWSPKGDRIAFHRRIAGHLQVFTMNADGTDELQLTFTPIPGSSGFPGWGKWAAQLR